VDTDASPISQRQLAGLEAEWSGAFPLRSGEQLDDICDVEFPIVLRGYSREAVDAYVGYVNQVVHELRMNRSPRSAIRNALDRAGDQASGLLREARAQAGEVLAQAEREANGIRERAREQAFEITLRANSDADAARTSGDAEAERLREQGRRELDHARARMNQELGEHRARIAALHAERAAAVEAAHALAVRLQSLTAEPPASVQPADRDADVTAPVELTDALEDARTGRGRRSAGARRR
jgi:DivIVA domain-containing protein